MDAETADSGEKWQPLAFLVASGSTVKDAAEQLTIPERTAYRYASLPEFRQCVSRIRSEALDAAVGALNDLTAKAVKKLEELLDGPEALGAIKTVLGNVSKLSEIGELRQRLDALEKRETSSQTSV